MINPNQFTVHATFLAQPGKYEAMKAISRESFALTQATSGLLQLFCLEPPKAEKPFVIVSIWQSKADFQTFLKTAKMQAFHNKQAIEKLFETTMAKATADFYTVMDAWHAPH